MSDTHRSGDDGSDGALVRRLADGDPGAMKTLFERHRQFVFRVARGMCIEREDAVDVVQDVFLVLHEQASRLVLDESRLSTWLYRVARNKSMDRHRKEARDRTLSPQRDAVPQPDAALLLAERRSMLRRAAAVLPDRPREVFVLRIGMGLSVEQTATLIGIRPGAVRVALHRAKTLLREALDQQDDPTRGHHARSATTCR